MNYLHDKQYINSQSPMDRMELIQTSAYWNDFDSALEVLKHSTNVDKQKVINLARATMLRDCSLHVI